MSRSNSTIDDGTERVPSSVDDGPTRNPAGSEAPENGDTKPERTIAGFATVNPLDVGSDAGSSAPGSGEPRRGRGRPKGSRNTAAPGNTTTPKVAANLEGLEKLLLSSHMMLAGLLHAPYFALDKDEAKSLADAAKEVAKYYSFTMDPKTLAILQLSLCGLSIYGPRVVTLVTTPGRPRPPKLEPIRKVESIRKETEPGNGPQPVPQAQAVNSMEQPATNPVNMWPFSVDPMDEQ